MMNEPSKIAGGLAGLHDQPPSVPAITAPVAASTATTCVPNIPVTDSPGDGGGWIASAKGLAGIPPKLVHCVRQLSGLASHGPKAARRFLFGTHPRRFGFFL
jgi:hypothetical protein